MDKSTKQLLEKVAKLQKSEKEGKKLCLEGVAIVQLQMDLIVELVEAFRQILPMAENWSSSDSEDADCENAALIIGKAMEFLKLKDDLS